MVKLKDDISIVLTGEAGQGLNSIENVLTKVLKFDGINVFSTSEFMSRIRGGCNSTEIRISSKEVNSAVERIDILMPFTGEALIRLEDRIGPETIIIGEKEKLKIEHTVVDVPFSKTASEIGNPIYANTVAVGVICGIIGVDLKIVKEYLISLFSKKGEAIANNNAVAAEKGYAMGKDLCKDCKIELKRNPSVKNNIVSAGYEAISMGAIAGGCNFISTYPMSPGTSVLTFLAGQSKDFNIIAEQAEDEISAINMAIGAWYAGGRAMVTTSGGGFALMVEGLSLSGMIETPVVVHIGQRPGPATGLPTRTEQGDLELALYAGHGDFPRIILAPGTPEDAFYLTQQAFNLADKYQSPVIILSDQYFLDSYFSYENLDINKVGNKDFYIKTTKDYRRYELNNDGISPRGIPGYGEGLVSVDSDEHNEEGHITEDLNLRVNMMNKRMKKFDKMKDDCIEPELIGNENYKTLVIGWGSTYYPVKEALENLDKKNTAFLHFKQVYPVPPEAEKYFKRADKVVMVENNYSGQFGKLLKLSFGICIDHNILKYNGLQFFSDELLEEFKKINL